MFEHIKIFTLRAAFSAKEKGTLPPYLGSTIRGILGHCIREFVCQKPKTKCFMCERRDNCLYVKCFSNTGKEGGAVNPYTLHVLIDGKTEWNVGDECVFDLKLFGSATEQIGVYLDALLAMERKGWGVNRIPFQLVRITEAETGTLIYAGGKTWMRNLIPHSMSVGEKTAKTAMIRFDTPLRIVTGKNLCHSISFETLIRFISRRISLISQIYTEHRIEWNEEAIIEQAERIQVCEEQFRLVDFHRYSLNQKGNRLDLPAIEGWAVFDGDLTELTPILEAGKYFHVGKGATIGFGHYEVFYDR
ncbi:CRISPR system precrRNA processing endoribonuclease RAMP protein Cas6 [Velocimicrobium porci]|uniref:CRISPR system precrRNA processing endoribonuclease RAMP protein Cas6 n=1 Tax=Velocimicrobium porci TaxID=2606634 RepID=A0A6L5XY93_9FIRM|nr:CRISPR system precrRNA processing endoribonuclease RAMP protein Cas6 [Velocimicrobium porci]MSS63644.1 CRISPR system precrRNA processing endoribonuclease RAMP protein Cas6 [Velocimicrobium porci]